MGGGVLPSFGAAIWRQKMNNYKIHRGLRWPTDDE
jgi:hypothetical protein